MRALQACRAWMQGLGSLMQTAAAVETTAAMQQQCGPFVRQRIMAAPSGTLILQQQVSPAVNHQQQEFSSSCSSARQQQAFLHTHQRVARAPATYATAAVTYPILPAWRGPPTPPQPPASAAVTTAAVWQQCSPFCHAAARVKYRKAHKSQGFNETICPNTRQLAFGLYGVRAMEHCRMPAKTIEAARRTLRRTITKTAMLWVRVTPNVPVTSKPAEVRMGKGKGTLDYWAAPIRPGQIIFEIDRCTRLEALAAVKSIEAKMPIKVGFVEWN